MGTIMEGSQGAGTPVLAVHGLSKSFGPVRALRNVDLELHAGEVLGLVGDNGAGKSTLVKCIAAVHRPDSGAMYIDGRLHSDLTPEHARELGIGWYTRICPSWTRSLWRRTSS